MINYRSPTRSVLRGMIRDTMRILHCDKQTALENIKIAFGYETE